MEFSCICENKRKSKIVLDPRTKIFILLTTNICTFTVSQWQILGLMVIIPLSLIFLNKKYAMVFVLASIYYISLFFYGFYLNNTHSFLSIFIAMITSLINRMGPGLIAGYYLLKTTTVSEFIAAMERMKIHNNVIIPLSVMFRFFPTIKEEMSSINDAMRMRGISIGNSNGNIISLLEYRIVPLFVSSAKIGEELSCSSITRGLGGPVKRTNICNIGFTNYDRFYGILIFVVILLSALRS